MDWFFGSLVLVDKRISPAWHDSPTSRVSSQTWLVDSPTIASIQVSSFCLPACVLGEFAVVYSPVKFICDRGKEAEKKNWNLLMCFSQFKIRSCNFETGIEGIYVVNSCAITSIEVYILPSSSRLLQHLLAVISRRHEYHSRSDSRGWNYLLWIWPIHSTSEFSRWVLEIIWITAVQFCIKIGIFLYHEHVLFFLFSA